MLINPFIYGGGLPQVPAAVPQDSYFKNVVLFVDGEGVSGTNVAQDRSLHQLVPSALDPGVVITNSDHRYGASCLSFPTGKNLQYTTANIFQALWLNTGDFTLEGSFFIPDLSANFYLFTLAVSEAAGRVVFFIDSATKQLIMNRYGSNNYSFGAASAVTAGRWNDIALVRSGANVTAYLNGVAVGTLSADNSGSFAGAAFGNGTGGLIVGSMVGLNYSAVPWKLAHLRVTRGLARTIKPMTKPFDVGYDPALLQLNFEAALGSSTIYDESLQHPAFTTVGTAPTLGQTFPVFGRESLEFGGAGGIRTPLLPVDQLDAADWTISGYYNMGWDPSASDGGVMSLMSTWVNGGGGWRLSVNSNRSLIFTCQLVDGTTVGATSLRSVGTNRMNFVAVCRSGQFIWVFCNGIPVSVLVLPAVNSRIKDGTSYLNIGAEQGSTWWYNGQMDNVRVKVGKADYTVAWPAVTTGQYPTDTAGDPAYPYVSLLLQNTQTLKDQSPAPQAVVNAGGLGLATVFGQPMLNFTNAANSYLTLSGADGRFAFGASNFVIELDYVDNGVPAGGHNGIIDSRDGNFAGWTLEAYPGLLSFQFPSNNFALYIPVTPGVLSRVVIVRSGVGFFALVNGVLVAELGLTAGQDLGSVAVTTLRIGTLAGDTPHGGYYLANLRITKGRVRSMPTQRHSLPTRRVGRAYARWDQWDKGSTNITLSNGDLTYTGRTAVRATVGLSTGKWYWEIQRGASGDNPILGVGTANAVLDPVACYPGIDANGWGFYGWNATKVSNGNVQTSYGFTLAPNDIVGVYLDCDAGTLGFTKNGVDMGIAFTGLQGKTLYPMIGGDNAGADSVGVANFGQAAFSYAAPTGYTAGVYDNQTDEVVTYSANDTDGYDTALRVSGETENGPFHTTLVTDTGHYAFRQNDAFTSGVQYRYRNVKSGQSALYVPSTGSFAKFASNAVFNLNIAQWTWRAWVYETAASGAGLLGRRASGASSGVGWALTTQSFRAKLNGTWNDVALAWTRPSLNAWHHYQIVKDGSALYAFVDGVLVASRLDVTSLDDTAIDLAIGSNLADASENRFDGYINDLEFWPNQVLNSASFGVPTTPYGNGSAKDPYFSNVEFLLHADGADGSTVFTDSSTRAVAITRNGNAKVSVTNARAGYGQSAYFDGVSSYLTLPQATAFQIFGGDFTLEFDTWYASAAGNQCLIQFGTGTGNRINLSLVAGALNVYGNAVGNYISSVAPAVNQWHHVVLMRSSGVLYLLVDGVQAGTSGSATFPVGDLAVCIGSDRGQGSTEDFTGYIDELRITKGVARYAGSFAPPTQAFGESVAADPSYASVGTLLHFGGANNSQVFTDSSATPKVVTAAGTAKISTTQAKFGGSALQLSGNGDSLSVAADPTLSPGTTDWTFEGWVYPTYLNPTGNHVIATRRPTGGVTSTEWMFWIAPGSVGSPFRFIGWQDLGGGNGAIVIDIQGGMAQLNVWQYFAVVKKGTTYQLSVNGVVVAQGAETANITSNTQPLYIGRDPTNAQRDFVGFMDELRITKGVARYSPNFAVPTAAFGESGSQDPSFASVELLLHADQAAGATVPVDSSSRNRTGLSWSGTAAITSVTTKFGVGALSFPGSTNGYVLSVPDDPAWAFGTGDFTIEMWGNLNTINFGPIRTLVGQRVSSAGPVYGWEFAIAGSTLYWWQDGVQYGSADITGFMGTYHHFAVQRSNGKLMFFFDGVLKQTVNAPASHPDYAGPLQIGGINNAGMATNGISGCIDELRITKGVARYSAPNFTPAVRPGFLTSRKRLVNLTGAAGAGAGYQVLLKVGESASAAGADFSINTSSFPTTDTAGDVSFTSQDGATTYPMWVEQVVGAYPNRTAWVWVKVGADLSTNQSIYCKYGSGVAAPAPDGNQVFELFDDFTLPNLDQTKWKYQDNGSNPLPLTTGAIANGELSITGAGNNYLRLDAVNLVGDNRELLARMSPSNTSVAYTGYFGFAGTLLFQNDWENTALSEVWRWSNASSFVRTNLDARYANAYRRMQMRRSAGAGSFLIDGAVKFSAAAGVLTAPAVLQVTSSYDSGLTSKVDWTAVKKYQVVEPTFTSANAEEMGSNPLLDSIKDLAALSKFGSVALWLDGADSTKLSVTAGKVSSWVDKVSGTAWTQATGANQPSLSPAGGKMALQSVDFGVNLQTYLQAATPAKTRRLHTVFLVGYWDTSASSYSFLGLYNGVGSSAIQTASGLPQAGIQHTPSGANTAQIQASSGYSASAGAVTRGQPFILEMVHEGTWATCKLNLFGVTKALTSSGVGLPEAFAYSVLGSPDSLYTTNGAIGEVIAFDGTLSNFDRFRLLKALAAKWRIDGY